MTARTLILARALSAGIGGTAAAAAQAQDPPTT